MTKKNTLKDLIGLFNSFFIIGMFTIGGGLAMVPLIERVVVEDKKWLSEDEMVDCLAITQGLPGVIAINIATYIGYKKNGIKGSIAATLGVVLPSFVIIIMAILLLKSFGTNKYLDGAFVGIKAAVSGLILVTVFSLGHRILKNPYQWAVALICFIATAFLNITAIWSILAAALSGVLYNMIKNKIGEKK